MMMLVLVLWLWVIAVVTWRLVVAFRLIVGALVAVSFSGALSGSVCDGAHCCCWLWRWCCRQTITDFSKLKEKKEFDNHKIKSTLIKSKVSNYNRNCNKRCFSYLLHFLLFVERMIVGGSGFVVFIPIASSYTWTSSSISSPLLSFPPVLHTVSPFFLLLLITSISYRMIVAVVVAAAVDVDDFAIIL